MAVAASTVMDYEVPEIHQEHITCKIANALITSQTTEVPKKSSSKRARTTPGNPQVRDKFQMIATVWVVRKQPMISFYNDPDQIVVFKKEFPQDKFLIPLKCLYEDWLQPNNVMVGTILNTMRKMFSGARMALIDVPFRVDTSKRESNKITQKCFNHHFTEAVEHLERAFLWGTKASSGFDPVVYRGSPENNPGLKPIEYLETFHPDVCFIEGEITSPELRQRSRCAAWSVRYDEVHKTKIPNDRAREKRELHKNPHPPPEVKIENQEKQTTEELREQGQKDNAIIVN